MKYFIITSNLSLQFTLWGFVFLMFYFYICIMEQRSTHYGDVAKWIEKVIDSCETYQQTFTAKKLITNFAKQLRTKSPDKYWRDYQYSVIWPLEAMVTSKRQSYINKIEE